MSFAVGFRPSPRLPALLTLALAVPANDFQASSRQQRSKVLDDGR